MHVPVALFGVTVSMLGLPTHSWPIAEETWTIRIPHRILHVFDPLPLPDLNGTESLTDGRRERSGPKNKLPTLILARTSSSPHLATQGAPVSSSPPPKKPANTKQHRSVAMNSPKKA